MFTVGPDPIDEPKIWRYIHNIAAILLVPWKALQLLYFRLRNYSVALMIVAALLAVAGTQYLSYRALRDIAYELRHFTARVMLPVQEVPKDE